jgi:hypothetical protein
VPAFSLARRRRAIHQCPYGREVGSQSSQCVRESVSLDQGLGNASLGALAAWRLPPGGGEYHPGLGLDSEFLHRTYHC